MMLLGVVLHSALTYNVTVHTEAWGLNQHSNHVATDFLVLLIHTFRMPIFFLVAGFFGALLFYERGQVKMSRNRVQRIVYPFLVFMVILIPVVKFTFNYTGAVFNGADSPLGVAAEFMAQPRYYLPSFTSHLWFLYYLAIITFTTVVGAIVLRKSSEFTERFFAALRWVMARAVLRVLVLAGLTYLILVGLGTSMVGASTSIVPDFATFVFYGWFYLVGWLLYKIKDILPRLKDKALIATVLGLALVAAQGILIQFSGLGLEPGAPVPIMFALSSLIVWLFVFGITGLFLKHADGFSPRMRYVSDAAYWVYLIHLPFTALLPGLIDDWPLPALAKFFLVMSVTASICFLSYHYLVRSTFIGEFLNGRRYARGLPR